MERVIVLEPGINKITERWHFECRVTGASEPKYIVRGIVLNPERTAPRRQPDQPATTLVLSMSRHEAAELAVAISDVLKKTS